MTKCAKCEKSFPKSEMVGLGMGMSVYGRKNHPHICDNCYYKWCKEIIPKYNKKYGQDWASHWKERFEEWLGYEWTDDSREVVVFT